MQTNTRRQRQDLKNEGNGEENGKDGENGKSTEKEEDGNEKEIEE